MPAGWRFVTSAPGRLWASVHRHYDRCARCSLQAEPAPAGYPCLAWRWLRETWPGAESLGCVSPLDKSRSGTPEGVRVPLDARRTLQVRLLRIAPFGVLLPFLSFVPRLIVMVSASTAGII